jgi:hypothetical protein
MSFRISSDYSIDWNLILLHQLSTLHTCFLNCGHYEYIEYVRVCSHIICILHIFEYSLLLNFVPTIVLHTGTFQT